MHVDHTVSLKSVRHLSAGRTAAFVDAALAATAAAGVSAFAAVAKAAAAAAAC